jgi:hypothetical protein
MLEGLKQFETYRGVVQDAKSLLRAHEEAMKAAADLAARPELTGKTPEQLDAQQRADLGNLGARQEDLGRNLAELEAKMDDMAGRLDENDPLAAAALREAAQQSRRDGTAARMEQSGRQARDNQMGSARAGQEQARNDLQKLVDNLENRREQELARLVKELRETEHALQSLQRGQQKVRDATAQARQNPDAAQRAEELQRLAKEQQQLEQETRRQLQRLQKLRAQAAARAGARAAGSMANAQQNLDQDEGE